MQPLHVVVADESDEVGIYGVNETPKTWRGTLRRGIFKLAGGFPMDQRTTVNLPPNASTLLASFRKTAWKNQNASAAFALLLDSGNVVARNRLFLPLFKDLKWPAPRLKLKVEKGRAIFTSDKFVWGVCLDLNGEKSMPDNFFDVYPGIPHIIPWKGSAKPKILFVGNLV